MTKQRSPSPTPDRARLPKPPKRKAASQRVEAAELEARGNRLLQMAATMHGEALSLHTRAAALRLQSEAK